MIAFDYIAIGAGAANGPMFVEDPRSPIELSQRIIDNKTAATTGRLLASYAASPRRGALLGIFMSALRR